MEEGALSYRHFVISLPIRPDYLLVLIDRLWF